jgi:tetratricopeptide (TPR) repeat protein
MEIYLYRDGSQIGPYPDTQIAQMLGEGLITESDFFFDQDANEWKPLSEFQLFPHGEQTARRSKNKKSRKYFNTLVLIFIGLLLFATGLVFNFFITRAKKPVPAGSYPTSSPSIKDVPSVASVIYSKESERYMKEAKTAWESTGSVTAIPFYTKAISADPSNIDAYFCRGYAMFEYANNTPDDGFSQKEIQNEFDQSIADFSKCIELNPSYAYGYYHRGLSTAMKVYKQTTGPGSYSYSRGVLEGYQKAIEDYQKTLSLDPKDKDIVDDAIKKVTKLYEDGMTELNNREATEQKRVKTAKEEAEKPIQFNPKNPKDVADIYINLKLKDGSVKDAKYVGELKVDPRLEIQKGVVHQIYYLDYVDESGIRREGKYDVQVQLLQDGTYQFLGSTPIPPGY